MKDQVRLRMVTLTIHNHGNNDHIGRVRLARAIDCSVTEKP